MRLYAVFLRNHGQDPDSDLVLVKEGFSWPALIFTFVWALFVRMWWPAVVIFTAVSLVGTLPDILGWSEQIGMAMTLAVSLAIGLTGNDIRRWDLSRRGFQEVGIVMGKNKIEAERRFLDGADISPAGIFPRAA